MFKRRIYLDYASLTPIDPAVLRTMKKYSSDDYANPSSLYKEGVAAKKALDDARNQCAKSINAHGDEIIFTSGGTEANNLAILGAVESLREKGVQYSDMHVIASVIEHSSVREIINYLNGREVATDIIEVTSSGLIDPDDLKKKIRPNTVIVSIMTVNNEIGTIQSIREIAKVIRQARKSHSENSPFNFQAEITYPLFHTDAAQAPLYLDLNVEKLGVDLLTLDGSKIYGPRGIGALYIKRNVPITRILHGGGQERGMRAGTEPLPLIGGLAKALEMAIQTRDKEVIRVNELRSYFIREILNLKSGIKINGENNEGAESKRSPHIINVSIPGIDGEFFLLQLDAKGLACSTKSSCLRDEDESYVLKAIGADSKTSIRFSIGRFTGKSEIKKAIKIIKEVLSTYAA